MLGSRITGNVLSRVASRNFSTKANEIHSTLYHKVWRKSNVMYIAYIATGCVVLGSMYAGLVNSIWESVNRGVSFINIIFAFIHTGYFNILSFFRNYITKSTGPSSSPKMTRNKEGIVLFFV